MKRKILFPGLIGLGLLIMTLAIVSSCKKKDDTTPPVPVMGCMNSSALNFNSLATQDDGTCVIPEVKERSIMFDFTATWCGPCGAQGIPMFTAAIDANKNEVVPMACHNSDEMSNPTSEAFLNDYNVTGIPTIAVANQPDVWGTSALNTAISSNNATATIANACCMVTTSGTTFTINTQTKFFTATTGDYYLGTYMIESGLVYHQNSATPDPFTHKHVLRGVAAGDEYGELIATGTIAANTVKNKTYTVTAGTGWNMANVYVALVIWKKSGSVWTFVNAWQSKAN